MSEEKARYIEGVGWRNETLHSMHRRMEKHDYQGRCIYMLTMAVEGRRPLLGRLRWPAGRPEEARVEPTALGLEVERCWLAIPEHYPGVEVLALQVMEDHVHGLLFVTREQGAHLGQMVKGFKIGCSRAKWALEEGASEGEAGWSAAGRSAAGRSAANYNSPNRTGGQSASRAPNRTDGQSASGAGTLSRQSGSGALSGQSASGKPAGARREPLFEAGYQDSILMGKGQLENMFAYIASNPYRLAMKRENPDLFRVVRELTVEGMKFAAIGNGWLLQRPVRLQVRCHNNQTPRNLQLIARQKAYFLERGQKERAVVVSPCISAGEKEIARAALDAGVPLIVVLENGFPPMYKPPGKYFDACAKGLLLMLAPWPYHMERRTITRRQCLELNGMALRISSEPWTREMERKMEEGE